MPLYTLLKDFAKVIPSYRISCGSIFYLKKKKEKREDKKLTLKNKILSSTVQLEVEQLLRQRPVVSCHFLS